MWGLCEAGELKQMCKLAFPRQPWEKRRVTHTGLGEGAGHTHGSLRFRLSQECGNTSPASASRVSLDLCELGLLSYSLAFFVFFISAPVFFAVAPGALTSWGKWVLLLLEPLESDFFLCLVLELVSLQLCISLCQHYPSERKRPCSGYLWLHKKTHPPQT